MPDLLEPEQFQEALVQCDGWVGTRESGISKTFTFANFREAMEFVNLVADEAEKLRHHPDISITWATVDLSIISHAAHGVTQTCFDLAHRIDELRRPPTS